LIKDYPVDLCPTVWLEVLIPALHNQIGYTALNSAALNASSHIQAFAEKQNKTFGDLKTLVSK